MGKRIDVNKLRGIYYNNDKDSYAEADSISSMKRAMAEDADAFAVNGYGGVVDEIEDGVVKYIKTMYIRECNDIFNADSRKLGIADIPMNLLKIYGVFKNVTSLSNILLIYCDYFNLKYEVVIKDLPNGAKVKLYEELSRYTTNKSLLNDLLVCDDGWTKLF